MREQRQQQKSKAMTLTPKQMLLAELVADPLDKRTKEEKCKEAGFGNNRIYDLQKKPEFMEYVTLRTNELLQVLRPMAIQGLAHEMLNARGSRDRQSACIGLLKVSGDIGGQNINISTTVNNTKKLEDSLPEWRKDRGLEVTALGVKVKKNGKGNGSKR